MKYFNIVLTVFDVGVYVHCKLIIFDSDRNVIKVVIVNIDNSGREGPN